MLDKVRKRAKIKNGYNQPPHLTQDTQNVHPFNYLANISIQTLQGPHESRIEYVYIHLGQVQCTKYYRELEQRNYSRGVSFVTIPIG